MRNKFFAFFALSILTASGVPAQVPAATVPTPISASELSRSSFGIQGGVNGELLTSSFYGIPECPQCSPLITSGTGLAGGIEGFYRYWLNNSFDLSFGLGYGFANGVMSQDEITSITLDGVASPATIDHIVNVTANRVSLVPSIGYNVFSHLSVEVGTAIGFLINPTFSSYEELVQPANRGVFDNGLRTRNEFSGALPGANNLQSALILGIRYALPMNESGTLSLVPSVMGSLGLTNLISGVNWKENGVGGALAIEYRPTIPSRPVPMPIPMPMPTPDTVRSVHKVSGLLASISAEGVDSAGTETNRITLRIEEWYETSLVPLVPYVFFDSQSSELPSRYRQLTPAAASAFRETKLSGADRLALYDELLNTVGSRLRQHSAARISLTACGDPGSLLDTSLARDRGETVKNYLAGTWGINPSRITTRIRMLPERPSPFTDTDGAAEDRRVEIASDDPSILDPVLTCDTLRTATPPIIRFHPTIQSERDIMDWDVSASQNGTALKTFTGTGQPPATLDWIVGLDQATVPRAPGTLDFRIHVKDAGGHTFDSSSTLPVEQLTLRNKRRELVQAPNGQAEIERYTLLLFDFNSSELSSDESGSNEQTLSVIRSRVTEHSQVTIQGFGDRIGDSEYNKKLALERAENVAKALKLPESTILSSKSSIYPYDNNLPEGRFYSRTVEITIQTPLQNGD